MYICIPSIVFLVIDGLFCFVLYRYELTQLKRSMYLLLQHSDNVFRGLTEEVCAM